MDVAEICRACRAPRCLDPLQGRAAPHAARQRRDGPDASQPPISKEAKGKAAWAMMTPMQRERFKVENDLDLAWQLSGVGRFRVNVFRQRQSIGMVLRTIPTEVKTIDELRLPSLEGHCSIPGALYW